MTDFNTENRKEMLEMMQGNGHLSTLRRRRNSGVVYDILLIVVGLLAGSALVLAITPSLSPRRHVVVQPDCTGCHQRIQSFADYFRKAGSKSPQQMAEAVLSTRNPRLMAALAKVETGGNPHIRRAGFRKQHDGAFQVNPRHWGGKVSYNAVEQALQAEAIITELTQTMPIGKALSLWGGDSTDRFQRKVLAELEGAPR